MALSHVVGDKVEAACMRSDLFEKRRSMMDDWATFLQVAEDQANTVVQVPPAPARAAA